MIDRAACIFGNVTDDSDHKKACASKERFAKKYGDDTDQEYHLIAEDLPVIGDVLGVRNLVMPAGQSDGPAVPPLDLAADAAAHPAEAVEGAEKRRVADAAGKPVVVGNIRMGFGHYRIAMAMASAAHAMGYTPYWFDLCSFPETTCTKVIQEQNKLYSLGSRLSSKVAPFNKLVWEPLNSEGFRQISYNASDQKNSELMVAPYADLPKDVPFIGTHVWPAQAAVHAGLTNVVNAIPDNWPMALHLAEGSIHTVQTPSAQLGYRALRGMNGGDPLKPMPAGTIHFAGHYIDHELVSNIEQDCLRRIDRALSWGPQRYLLTVGGAGAQLDLFVAIVRHLLPEVQAGRASLMVNFGDHFDVMKQMRHKLAEELAIAEFHEDDFQATAAWAAAALDGEVSGIHAFCHEDIFAAVYSTNLLMRACDFLVTKPSELAFYPVPKLMIHRVGGHEAWGAIRAAELGDGTYELETPEETCAMIDLLQEDRSIMVSMCERICANKLQGVYDGAYRVVEFATQGEWA